MVLVKDLTSERCARPVLVGPMTPYPSATQASQSLAGLLRAMNIARGLCVGPTHAYNNGALVSPPKILKGTIG